MNSRQVFQFCSRGAAAFSLSRARAIVCHVAALLAGAGARWKNRGVALA